MIIMNPAMPNNIKGKADLPKEIRINLYTILNRHRHKAHNFAAITINPTYMSDSKHNQLLILVNMKLVAKIISMIGHWINLPGN